MLMYIEIPRHEPISRYPSPRTERSKSRICGATPVLSCDWLRATASHCLSALRQSSHARQFHFRELSGNSSQDGVAPKVSQGALPVLRIAESGIRLAGIGFLHEFRCLADERLLLSEGDQMQGA